MPNSSPAPSTERIPLHSMAGKPVLCVFTGIYGLGVFGQVLSILKHEVNPVVSVVVVVLIGLSILKLWDFHQRVYMTREGIELTSPPRLVPWARVGDAFRVPMTGLLAPLCCIGIRDAENWDLRFIGRIDFERVFEAGRPELPPKRRP